VLEIALVESDRSSNIPLCSHRGRSAHNIGMAELIEVTTFILTNAQKGIIKRRALVYKGHKNRWLTLE